MKKSKGNRTLADDIRVSFHEALALAGGKRTKAKVHRVTPREIGPSKTRRTISKQMAS